MSSDAGLDDTLIDLFRSEVETHSEVLSSALLALERAPRDTSRIDEMMRAAHSIKGAARVVGVVPAASVAHVMEDCFVEAQKGAISFSSGDIDILLRGVDLLGKISAATRDPSVDLSREFDRFVQAQVVELQAVLSGTGKSAVEQTAVVQSQAAVDSKPVGATPPSAPGVVTIPFPAMLDSVAAEGIRGQILAAMESRCDTLRVDLSSTRDLDVQGLALLAAIPRHLTRHGGPSLELSGVSAEMETVLRVTGLGKVFGHRCDATQEAE